MPGTNPKRIAKLKAQRELVDGKWVSTHPNCKHGTATGCNYYSCRCDRCTEWRKAADKVSNERRYHNRLIIQGLKNE